MPEAVFVPEAVRAFGASAPDRPTSAQKVAAVFFSAWRATPSTTLRTWPRRAPRGARGTERATSEP